MLSSARAGRFHMRVRLEDGKPRVLCEDESRHHIVYVHVRVGECPDRWVNMQHLKSAIVLGDVISIAVIAEARR